MEAKGKVRCSRCGKPDTVEGLVKVWQGVGGKETQVWVCPSCQEEFGYES